MSVIALAEDQAVVILMLGWFTLSPRMSRPLGKKITWIGKFDKHRLWIISNGRSYRIRRLILYIRYGYGK